MSGRYKITVMLCTAGAWFSTEVPAASRQPPQQFAVIHQPLGEQVHDFSFALQHAEDAEEAGGEEFAALAFGEVGVDDDVGQPGFVFDGQEDDAAGGAGALAAGDDTGAAGGAVVFQGAQGCGGEVALGIQVRA